jgi:hypothetical protein
MRMDGRRLHLLVAQALGLGRNLDGLAMRPDGMDVHALLRPEPNSLLEACRRLGSSFDAGGGDVMDAMRAYAAGCPAEAAE